MERIEKTGGIVLNELRFSGPGEIAFEAHQRSIHRRWFQTESDLEIVSIADEERGSNYLRSKGAVLLHVVPAVFAPGNKLTKITQIVAHGKEILSASLFVPSYPLLFFSLLVFALITFS